MAAPTHLLGPLPAAPHHRRTRRTGPGRAQRLIAAAVLGLTLPLAAASAAAAAVGPAAASPSPFTAEPAAVGRPEPAAVPAVGPPRHPRPGRGDARVYRRWVVWAPERADTAPERAPDRAPEQNPEHAPEQNPDQVPDRSTGQAGAGDRPEADQGTPDAAAPGADAAPDAATAAAAATAQAVAAAVPAVLPARWRDASTVQFPLGAGLGLIGCGLGLIGLRLRRG
ncbi:hypothetical protein [Kitasatospora sp. NPDC091276]|uniref:hypothetical protein n=1 Tax=Kitasatospora sp. NPDC091276 TaxID=3155300 RepID=UPI003424EF89